MKKSLKILYTVLSVIVILLIVVVIAINLFADSAVKMAIESAGTKALQVGVAVDSVDLSILGGKIGFQNLVIDNPPGYKHERLLELGKATIAVQTGSLLTDIVNIKDIRLDGLNVVLEQRGVTSNNLQDIMKSLPTKEKESAEPAEPTEPGGKKLHIDNLEITNVQVNVKLLPVPGKADTLKLKLDPIKMTDLGGENDIDTVALVREVLLALAGGIAKQGAGILPKEMLGSLTSQLGKFGTVFVDKGGKVLDVGKDVGGDAIKGAGGATKGITDGIKGLFKPKEDKE